MSTILIANDKDWEEDLDKPVRSSLQLKTIIFGLYNFDKLKEILQDRVKEGFYNNIKLSDKLVSKIVNFSIQNKSSDARFAIESLFRAAQRAEENSREDITQVDIEKSFITVEEDFEKESITTLSTNQFLVLYSCNSIEEISIEEAYKKYNEYVKQFKMERVKRIGKTRFRKTINYLDNQTLIRKIILAHEIGLRDTRIKNILKKEILEKEFNQRLQKVLT